MKEAVTALFDYCFSSLERHDLFIKTREDNSTVIALMGNLGLGQFAQTGYAFGDTASRTYTFGTQNWNIYRR